ncbi:MAG: ABC transporter substrate-binding protein [Bacilli bacterium]|nr:ABC transporter substrate-binding protein [Bacilli bacterium]
MQRNKFILGLSLVAIFATTSCGSKGFKHTRSSENEVYFADLDHDGKIANNEKNLTWAQSYNTLLSDANKMSALKKHAKQFNINLKDPKYGSLARYEIMHQAEELVMHTQAITPLYDYADPYLLKPDIVNIYECDLGYKFLDQLKWRGDSNKARDFTMCFGTKADTFDPGVNTDASTANVLSQVYTGAMRWQRTEIPYDPTGRGQEGAYLAELKPGVCDVVKNIVTSDNPLIGQPGYVNFADCPDLTGGQTDPKKYLENPEDYEGTARYTITIKDDDAEWHEAQKGGKPTPIVSDDFIYAWTRAASAIYNNTPIGMWCSLFDMIRGFDVWNAVGQQEHPEKWETFDPEKNYSAITIQNCSPTKDPSDEEVQTINTVIKNDKGDKYAVVNMDYTGGTVHTWEDAMNLTDDSKNPYFTELTNVNPETGDVIDNKKINRWLQNFNGIEGKIEASGAKGGMAGVMKGKPEDPSRVDKDKTFTVQLVNDSEYFEELLAFPAFMPVKKSEIIEKRGEGGEEKNVCTEKPSWYLNKGGDKGYHYTNGPLRIDGPIDNNDGGSIKLVHPNKPDPDVINSLTLKFIDKDGAAYDSYNSGSVQMIDAVASGIIDKVKKTDDWRIAPQIGLFYFIFNVNDNTFDLVREGEDKNTSERTREQLREIMNLLVNRNDLCQNIVKTGAKSANGLVTTGITERCVPAMAEVNGENQGYVALRGWKDDKDIVHPIYPTFTQDSDLTNYLADKYQDSEGHTADTLVTRDWHESNLDNFEHWTDGEGGISTYKDHWLDKRNAETIEAKKEFKDGFYSTVTTENIDDEQTSMRINLEKVEKIAKELEEGPLKGTGFKYIPSSNPDDYGYFENFPAVALATNTGTGIEDICERMQAYYSLWGIDMSIQTQEWQSYTATRRAGDYAYARHGWVADYNDPRTYLDTFRAGDGNNDTQLGNNTWHDSK